MQIAAVGKSEFTLGFELAGIRKAYSEEPARGLLEIRKDCEVGIVFVDKATVSVLGDDERALIQEAVKPVYVVLSKEFEDEGLRRLIKKSIGVDLWKNQAE